MIKSIPTQERFFGRSSPTASIVARFALSILVRFNRVLLLEPAAFLDGK
jgi:hypothetical protein